MAELDTIFGDLRAVAQLEPGTFQHWDELSRDQIQDAGLRRNSFYVADFPLYTAVGGKPTLGLARHTAEHPHNLVLAHLFDKENSSFDQLINTGNFRPDPDEARAVLEASDTLKVTLSDVHLSGNDDTYRFLSIRTSDGFIKADNKYQRPNEVEREVLHRVGYTSDFLGVLNSKSHNISETRLYVLNPDYVQKEVQKGPVGRAAWRYLFYNLADSNANYRNVINSNSNGLRGVRRVVAAGDASKNVEVPQEISLAGYYDALLARPQEAVAALNDQRAAGLAGLLQGYLANRRP